MLSSHCSIVGRPLDPFASLAFLRVRNATSGCGHNHLNTSMTPRLACTPFLASVKGFKCGTEMPGSGHPGLHRLSLVCQSNRPLACSIMRHQRFEWLKKYTQPSIFDPVSPPDSYTIAVPSYDRAPTLKCRTLGALMAASVDVSSRVDVFVANEQEAEKYRQELEPGTYANIIVGTLGIGKQRDFIMDYYGAGANVVMLDDDIQWFVHKYSGDVNMHNVILSGFELSLQHGCYMWGINNSSNKFYLKPTYSVGWCFFQGPFMAFRVRDFIRLDPLFHQTREDVQYSLMHCELDGKVLRLNGVGLKARPYGREPGGLQSSMTLLQRAQTDQENRRFLMDKYGSYIRSWTEDRPHPSLKRSPGHLVQPLEF